MNFVHTSVLLQECLQFLAPDTPNPLFIDGTLGEGGHTEAFLQAFPQLIAIGIDADPAIQAKARVRLAPFGDRAQFFLGWSDDFFTQYPDMNKRSLIKLKNIVRDRHIKYVCTGHSGIRTDIEKAFSHIDKSATFSKKHPFDENAPWAFTDDNL